MSAVLHEQSWRARLELGFARRAGRTVISRRKHFGPLVVQKPFYPEGDVCHVYLLHPPGGVVGGDRLEIKAAVDQHAHALITTPASGKFYRSNDTLATQSQHLTIASDAVMEWLPQETILFSGSHVAMTTRVDVAEGANFIGWDILCLGRPASGEQYDLGQCRQAFEIWQGENPILIERALFKGGSDMLSAPWGMAGYSVTGTMIALNADESLLAPLREIEIEKSQGQFSASLIDSVLVCRFLGHQGEVARRCFIQAWQLIRPKLIGPPVSVPRIWNT